MAGACTTSLRSQGHPRWAPFTPPSLTAETGPVTRAKKPVLPTEGAARALRTARRVERLSTLRQAAPWIQTGGGLHHQGGLAPLARGEHGAVFPLPEGVAEVAVGLALHVGGGAWRRVPPVT